MLILGDYLGIESVGYTIENGTSKNTFIFTNHDYCCEWKLKHYVFSVKSPAFPTELERLPERLFTSLIEDFIDVQKTTAWLKIPFQYGLAFDFVVNCVFLCLLVPYVSKKSIIPYDIAIIC